MPDFNSPLGRRQFASSGQRVLTVDDSTLNNQAREIQEEQRLASKSEEVEAIQTARRAAIAAARRISPVAKERIEILAGLGRCREKVEFEGVSFSIQSLKSGEMRDIVRISNNAVNASDSYFEARLQTLARAIYEIDDQPLSVVLGSNKQEDVLAWLEDMDENLVEFIHNHYLDMVKKNKTKFVIKDEKDAAEVAEEIKKS